MKDSEPTVVVDRKLPGLSSRLIKSFAAEAARAAGLRSLPDILLTNSGKLRQLNSRFRGKDSTTDVLSFPASAANGSAGDIAISLDIAARNAHALGHSVSDEVRVLILHGILHLAGYDHENDHGEMAKKEAVLRTRFGLPNGLIERNSIRGKRPSAMGRRSSKLRASSNSGQ